MTEENNYYYCNSFLSTEVFKLVLKSSFAFFILGVYNYYGCSIYLIFFFPYGLIGSN